MPDADDIMDTIEYNRDIVGVDYPVGSHEVTEEQVVGFANAIGETNPMYLDKEFAAKSPYGTLIAPPAYYTSIRLESAPDAEVKFGTTGFNASQHCEFYESMKVGTPFPPRPRSPTSTPRLAGRGRWFSRCVEPPIPTSTAET